MHTISKDGDGTWCVGRIESVADGSMWMGMFRGMPFFTAMMTVNMLNGGDGSNVSPEWIKALEKYSG